MHNTFENKSQTMYDMYRKQLAPCHLNTPYAAHGLGLCTWHVVQQASRVSSSCRRCRRES